MDLIKLIMAFVDFSKFKFLLIDDFANYRSMLKSVLRAGGAEQLDEASNGPDAIEKIANNRYDVILCDYNLGDGQDGQQILEEVKFRQLLPDSTIFIMVTAENTMAMVMGVIEYRPDDYLNKPFTKDVLKGRLDKIISRRKLLLEIDKSVTSGDYNQAIALCNKQMKQNPSLILDVARKKGQLLVQTGELTKSLEHYNNIIKASNASWARLDKAQIQIKLKNYAEAEITLKDLLSKDKQLIEAYDLLADTLLAQKKNTDAERFLKEGVKISPKGVSRQQRLARLALENGHDKVAEKAFKASIREGKYSCFGKLEDHIGLANIFSERHDLKNMLNVTSIAAQQFKRDKNGLFHLRAIEMHAYQKAGQDSRALELFEGIMRNMPDDLSALPKAAVDELVACAESMGESEIAESILEDVKNGRTDVVAAEKYASLLLNSKGVRLYKDGDIKHAIPLFRKAARFLDGRMSVNLNAAQAILMYMKSYGVKSDLLADSRTYLDRCKLLEAENDRYKKLENMYSSLA